MTDIQFLCLMGSIGLWGFCTHMLIGAKAKQIMKRMEELLNR